MASPMYRQIAEDLRQQIEAGALEPAGQLPTELDLRERYGASRNTIRDAVKLLTSLGLVETRPGQGTFVVREIDPHVTLLTTDPRTGPGGDITQDGSAGYLSAARNYKDVSSTEPQVEIQKANSLIADALGIADGSQVISRHQKRFIDGTPWALQTSFYPMGLALKGADTPMRLTVTVYPTDRNQFIVNVGDVPEA